MEKIRYNAGRLLLITVFALLITQCGKKGENKHFRFVAGAEWSPVSYNTMIISKDEYDQVVGATSGCGSEPVGDVQIRAGYSVYLSDTGETRSKQLFKNEQISAPHQIKWSPAGDRFILFGGRMSTLYIVDTLGAYVTTDSLNYTYYADWSPDGSQIVCSALRGSKIYPSMNKIDASTGHSSLIMDDSVHTGPVAWSAGNKIAYVYSRDSTSALALINSDGSGFMILDTLSLFSALAWSPDGSTLLFAKHLNYDADVYVRNIFTELTSQLLHYTDDTQIASLRYSPDGRKISYYLYGSSSRTYLYTMDLSDGNARSVAIDCGDGSWSPDSRQIAYVSYDDIFFKTVE